MRRRRRYSDREKAAALAALAANAGHLRRTSVQMGLPASTLSQWAHGQGVEGAQELLPEAREDLAEMFEQVAREAVGLLRGEKLSSASAQQLATVAGIAVDKARLLRGEPTHIAHREEVITSVGAIIQDPGVVRLLAELTRRVVPRAPERDRLPGDAGLARERPALAAGEASGAD
jgi:transposase-like protein